MTVSLQRETILPGTGNAGQVTFGGFPDGLTNDSFVWAPVRLYQSDTFGARKSGPFDDLMIAKKPLLVSLHWEIMLEFVLILQKQFESSG